MSDEAQAETPEPSRRTRRERFVLVATRRTNQVLRDLHRLSNCANKSAYSYSDEDVAKILAAIDGALEQVRRRFQPRKDGKEVSFKLE